MDLHIHCIDICLGIAYVFTLPECTYCDIKALAICKFQLEHIRHYSHKMPALSLALVFESTKEYMPMKTSLPYCCKLTMSSHKRSVCSNLSPQWMSKATPMPFPVVEIECSYLATRYIFRAGDTKATFSSVTLMLNRTIFLTQIMIYYAL